MQERDKIKPINSDIDFTATELEEWVKAGLIDENLLEDKNRKNLFDFIAENKSLLYGQLHENRDEFDCEVTIPAPHKLHETFELPVISKKTKKVVRILKRVTYFELFHGINLKVLAQELDNWEKTKSQLEQLPKNQMPDFLKMFSEMAKNSNGVFTRNQIQGLIENLISKKRKPSKIRQSGHYADSKLQHTAVDKPLPETQKMIEELGSTVTTYGIKLTASEDKLMNVIYKLLHDHSENKDTTSDQFYAGNEQSITVNYSGKPVKASVLRIKPAELYKEYLGKDNYSGKEIANVKSILLGLHDKKFLIRYDRKRKITKQGKVEILTDRIEDVKSLLNIVSYIEGLTEKELKKLDSGDDSIRQQKGELIIALNPLLTDQINSKYVEYPEDINQRTMIASGGPLRVTESIVALRNYLLREISAKRYHCIINEETLINQIQLSHYASSGRKKRVSQHLNNAIQVSKSMGIISSYKKETGSLGQTKYIFDLNKDF